MSPTEAELAAIRADAEAVAAAKVALVGKGHTHDAGRWQVDHFRATTDEGIWYVSNEDEDGSNRYDHFECPPEEYCRLLCEYRNRPLDGHVLALLAEVERCRAEKQDLVERLEELIDGWGERSDEFMRMAKHRPASVMSDLLAIRASTLRGCAEELDAAIPEPEEASTP